MRQTGLTLKEVAKVLFEAITDFKKSTTIPMTLNDITHEFADFEHFVNEVNGDDGPISGMQAPADGWLEGIGSENRQDYYLSVRRLLQLKSVEEVYNWLLDFIWYQIIDKQDSFRRNFWKLESSQVVAERMMEAYKIVCAQSNFFVDTSTNRALHEYVEYIVNGDSSVMDDVEDRVFNIFKVGIEKFVPGEISFYNLFHCNFSKSYWGTLLMFNEQKYQGVFYSTEDKQLIPNKRVQQNRRTACKCSSCGYVVSYNKDTVTARPSYSRSNRARSCMFCIIHRQNYVNFWNLDTQRFEYRRGDLDNFLNKQEWSDEIEAMIPRQSLRNIKRYNYMDAVKEMVYIIPFYPDTRQRDYSYELSWRYWYIDDDGKVGVKSTGGTSSYLIDKTDEKSHWESTQFPIGMELELEARSDVSADTEELLVALHKDFPYGLTGVANHKGQLAVGSYDGSLGRLGIEFKFQPMTAEFVRQLPDGFWTILKENFRGFYNKRCGSHMNMPKGLFTRQALALFVAWHNNAMLTYYQGYDDEYCALEDIMQRTNPSYATWHLMRTDTEAYDMHEYKVNNPDRYADILLNSGMKSARALYGGANGSFHRNSIVNYGGSGRIEYRGFASATIKDRIIKNFEFLTALHEYFEALSFTSVRFDRSSGEQGDFNFATNINAEESDIIKAHLTDEHLFYKWVTLTRGDVYPYLTKYVESVIMPKIGAKSMSRELFDYVNERTA